MRMAPHEGIKESGIGVNRNGEDVTSLVEDALRAVAVVNVDIEDRDALVAEPQMRGCDSAVVEKAEAAGDIAEGVMAGRPAQRVDRILTIGHQLRRSRRDIGGGARGCRGARPDRTRGVGGVPAQPADNVRRIRRGMTHRMHIGDHLRPGIAKRRPGVPGTAEKVQIFGTVNARPRPLPEHNRRDQLMLARRKPREQEGSRSRAHPGSP